MAIWQFKLDLIPEKSLRTKYGVVPIAIQENLDEGFNWWREVQPPVEFEKQIDAILPRTNSWSKSMSIWGDERSDTASVCYKDDTKIKVEWIGFRIDVQRISLVLLQKICALTEQWGCLFLTRENHIIVPEMSVIISEINNSTAKQFVEDPVSTLRNLKHDSGEIIQLPKRNRPEK